MSVEPLTPLPDHKVATGESPAIAAGLQRVHDVCKQMREHEAKVISLGKERRQAVSELRGHGVTWRKIAEWAGTTDQALYKHHNREK